ncbi:MAG TPA: right-handed parallel beta-helix repeat-containing protein [Methylomirabilota bacterium]|nr:right-handed parallel beta-helix repeat-containing protein [Methylomirabilota bacterium]
MSARRVPIAAMAFLVMVSSGLFVLADESQPPRTIEIRPTSAEGLCEEEFVTRANALRAGDELRLHAGIYSQDCARRIRGIRGTAQHPIVIRAAPGANPVLTRPRDSTGAYAENNLELEDVAYLVIRGLSLRGGTTGIRFLGANEHVTLEDNEISYTDNNAIAMNSGDTDSFVIRHNHIHHTGLRPLSLGTTEGEGLYVGCHDGGCVASNHVIEWNYIHHLRGTSEGGNDGIEIKRGSYGIVIRDNVIHDTTIGTRFPCIFVYGGGPAPNLVDGNAVWHCGEAIQVASDAIIRNNLIVDSDVGITAAPHRQVPNIRNVSIVNNTIHGHSECLNIRWLGAQHMILANNAVYCPRTTAVDASGLDEPGVTVAENLVEGDLRGPVALDGVGLRSGGQARAAFRNPGTMDYWPRPGGPLLGVGLREFTPPLDFNGTRRVGRPDVGAYQAGGVPMNPGWHPRNSFKGE